MSSRAVFVAGKWRQGRGELLAAEDPATGQVVWHGPAASGDDVADAVAAARAAFVDWSQRPADDRIDLVEAYARALEQARPALVQAIARDTGKPHWECETEVTAMVRKVAISIDAYHARTGERRLSGAAGTTVVRHRPHGVMAVFGPFNFPGHLPNGHIVPAFIAGNTVVCKPSELSPLTAEVMVDVASVAGIPPGVFNLVQGGRATGAALAGHPDIDGLLFTGSADTGRLLHRMFCDRPEAILALEMGGNNPMVVWDVADAGAAAWLIAMSAYASAGQRCTCVRRLILPEGAGGDAVLAEVMALIDRMRIGPPDSDPPPFMGPVISNQVADDLLAAQQGWLATGGVALRAMKRLSPDRPFVTPGLVDVTALHARADVERFGPLLQVVRVADFGAALAEANATRFGLAAGLVSDDASLWAAFEAHVRAGVVNWNRATTGAPSEAPFGGVGRSGNHRPAAYYAADYCAYPVVSVQNERVATPAALPPGFDPP